MNTLDKIIGYVAPEKQFKRMQARHAINIVKKRGFEGASKGRRTKYWSAPGTSQNAELNASLATLRNRCRDLVRNNPDAVSAKRSIVNAIIGKNGAVVQFKSKSKSKEKKIEKLWKEWAGTTKCDFENELTFRAMQKLVIGSVIESGEVIIRKRWTNVDKFPLKLQVLECDHIATDKIGNNVKLGIEVDNTGRKKFYHLYRQHPGGMSDFSNFNLDTIKVPVEDLMHVYEVLRPGQLRGISKIVPAIIKMRDLDEFEDAELVRQKVSSCFVGIVHDLEASGEMIMDDEELIDRMEPGMIETLPRNKTITFGNPTTKQGYKDFTNTVGHKIASGIGCTYEGMSGDLSGVNYSSARQGRIEFEPSVVQDQNFLLVDKFLRPVSDAFLEMLSLMGININGVDVQFIIPSIPMVDPTKEIPSKIKSLRAGLTTLSDAVAENGNDFEEHLQKIKSDMDALSKYNIIVDSNASQTTGNGMLQSEPESGTTQKENL